MTNSHGIGCGFWIRVAANDYNIRHRLFDRTASGPKAGVARHDIGHDGSEGVKRVRER
jgi:hypothetical protein